MIKRNPDAAQWICCTCKQPRFNWEVQLLAIGTRRGNAAANFLHGLWQERFKGCSFFFSAPWTASIPFWLIPAFEFLRRKTPFAPSAARRFASQSSPLPARFYIPRGTVRLSAVNGSVVLLCVSFVAKRVPNIALKAERKVEKPKQEIQDTPR